MTFPRSRVGFEPATFQMQGAKRSYNLLCKYDLSSGFCDFLDFHWTSPLIKKPNDFDTVLLLLKQLCFLQYGNDIVRYNAFLK